MLPGEVGRGCFYFGVYQSMLTHYILLALCSHLYKNCITNSSLDKTFAAFAHVGHINGH